MTQETETGLYDEGHPAKLSWWDRFWARVWRGWWSAK